MATRCYFSEIVGTGTEENRFRPAVRDAITFGADQGYSAMDGRADTQQPGGWMFVEAEVSDAQHTTLLGDARVVHLPFETGAGVLLALSATVSQVGAAKRTQILDRLEARHCPAQDFAGTDPLRLVLRRIVRRFRLRRLLGALDWTEGLDTLVSAIATQRRNAINARLQELGFDTSAVVLSDTIREALRKVVQQTNATLDSGLD